MPSCAEQGNWLTLLQGPGYTWDQTPETVEARLLLPAGCRSRDLLLEVRPRRLRVQLVSGAVLLEGALGGEVRTELGDYEWDCVDDALDVEGGRWLALTLAKRTVSYELGDQWSCLLDGPGHPQVDVTRLQWVRDRQWRPPRDAQTLEEVAQVLPGNRILAAPSNLQRAGEAPGDWGSMWSAQKQA